MAAYPDPPTVIPVPDTVMVISARYREPSQKCLRQTPGPTNTELGANHQQMFGDLETPGVFRVFRIKLPGHLPVTPPGPC